MDILFKFETPPAAIPPTAIPSIYPLHAKDPFFVGKTTIFDLPRDNSVASLSIDYSTLTSIEFKDSENLEYKKIKRKGNIDIFDGGFVVLPQKKMLGWYQGRGFQLTDIDKKKVFDRLISKNIDEDIENDAVIDEEKMIFCFEISVISSRGYVTSLKKGKPEDHYIIFRTMDLSQKEPIKIADNIVDVYSVTGGNRPLWVTHNKTIYHYSKSLKRLLTYDTKLSLINTPFAETYNKLGILKTTMTGLVFHSSLPLALFRIFVEGDDSSIIPEWWISVQEKDSCKFFPLILGKESIHCHDFSFSPDGNWIVFSYTTEYQGPPHYYYMKVNPKNPVFLEPPKYLGNIFAKSGLGVTTAWTTKPTCFVACDGRALYRWDMEKAAAGKMQDNKH